MCRLHQQARGWIIGCGWGVCCGLTRRIASRMPPPHRLPLCKAPCIGHAAALLFGSTAVLLYLTGAPCFAGVCPAFRGSCPTDRPSQCGLGRCCQVHLPPCKCCGCCLAYAPQVGDGTTTVVLLAAEFLKECKAFVEEGVHPQASRAGRRRVLAAGTASAAATAWRVRRLRRPWNRGSSGGRAALQPGLPLHPGCSRHAVAAATPAACACH